MSKLVVFRTYISRKRVIFFPESKLPSPRQYPNRQRTVFNNPFHRTKRAQVIIVVRDCGASHGHTVQPCNRLSSSLSVRVDFY